MKIKNFDELAISEARKIVLSIAETGLEAINTSNVLKNLVKINRDLLNIKSDQFNLDGNKKVIFIGIGKCAVEAGEVFEEILGEYLTSGAVIDVKSTDTFKKLTSFKGSHPLPSSENIEATKKIVALLNGLTKEDLVIFLISGGGSTLLCLPEKDGSEEEIAIVKGLMSKGATIQETNIVRKHLSLARGGWLAKYAYPAKVVSLIFSDVPGNDINFIASGPTVKDITTIADAEKVLAKYEINIEKDSLIETPKEEKYFENVKNILALSNQTALDAMAEKAKELEMNPKICNNKITGEASEVGKMIAEEIHKANKNDILLYGGETTVTLRLHSGQTGRGGRNLQLALSALQYLNDDEIIMTIASDGRDNGAFGGAVCDIITKKTIENAGLSLEASLKDNDAYPLFEKIGNYLDMGDTGSNVADLIIAMKIQ